MNVVRHYLQAFQAFAVCQAVIFAEQGSPRSVCYYFVLDFGRKFQTSVHITNCHQFVQQGVNFWVGVMHTVTGWAPVFGVEQWVQAFSRVHSWVTPANDVGIHVTAVNAFQVCTEDSIKSFVDVAFAIVNDEWPKTGILRVPDVETASGKKMEKVIFKEADYYISLVAEGKEDFVIFQSHDGFFQFYGVDNQFICEAWFNLGGRRAYGLINPHCTNTNRVNLVTPFGQYTPRERDIISLEQLKTAVEAYFSNLEEADFLAKVPHEELEM